MTRSIPCHAGLVLDLGCGLGHTIRLLGEACSARNVIGVDASEGFVTLARRLTADPRTTFVVQDVTRPPLPGMPADAIYARFLLTHLPSPLTVVDAWRGELRPGGAPCTPAPSFALGGHAVEHFVTGPQVGGHECR